MMRLVLTVMASCRSRVAVWCPTADHSCGSGRVLRLGLQCNIYMVECELGYCEDVVLVFRMVKYFVLVSAMNEDDLVW